MKTNIEVKELKAAIEFIEKNMSTYKITISVDMMDNLKIYAAGDKIGEEVEITLYNVDMENRRSPVVKRNEPLPMGGK